MKAQLHTRSLLAYPSGLKLSFVAFIALALLRETQAAILPELQRELVKVTNEVTDELDRGVEIPPQTLMAACNVLGRLADNADFQGALKQVTKDNERHRTKINEVKENMGRFTHEFINPEEKALKSYGLSDSAIRRLTDEASRLQDRLESSTSYAQLLSSVERFRDAVCDASTQVKQGQDAAEEGRRNGAIGVGLLGVVCLVGDIPGSFIPAVGPVIATISTGVGVLIIDKAYEELRGGGRSR
jgi:hypothetical protein